MASLAPQITGFARELTALFVEDDAVSRRLVSAQLRGVFKELLYAADGQEGLELFLARRPQVVLTDNVMPRLTGIAMTEAIRKVDPKVPVIFITANMDTALLVRAINLGIASIIPKPVVTENLAQALSLVVGLLENEHLQKKTVEQEFALLHFREKYHEFQQAQAFRKELSLLENDFLTRLFQGSAPERGQWLAQVVYSPHDIMCGDCYSLRGLRGGMLVLIADAMGKGLAASITTTLAVHTFNLQADAFLEQEGFQFPRFVQRYRSFMQKRLLEDEVLSLALAWLPADGSRMQLASFGMPPILVRHQDGGGQRLKANNPPLSGFGGEARIADCELGTARALLLSSDGLNEAALADGGLYRDHLEAEFLASGGRDQFWAAFRARVAKPDDDVTLLLLTRLDGVPDWEQRLLIPGRLERVEAACQELEGWLGSRTTLDGRACRQFSMAIREALMNAYEHGSLEVPSDLKRRLLEEDGYFDFLQERERTLDRPIEVVMSQRREGGNQILQVAIRDQGPGFAPPRGLFDDPDSQALCGRGLKMIRLYCDAFLFNEQGNAITLIRIYRGGNDATGAHGC